MNDHNVLNLLVACSGLNPSDPSAEKITRAAKQTIKTLGHGHVDSTAIRERLSGLEERYRVLFEDGLADALGNRARRLRRLQEHHAHIPECLHLLLSLSTGRLNPDFEKRLTQARAANLATEISWSDTEGTHIEDDDPAIWDNIEYGDCSSDDELIVNTSPLAKARLGAAFAQNEAVVEADSDDDSYVMDQDPRTIEEVQAVMFTRSMLDASRRKSTQQFTESMVIRESIHMLCGLHTTLFSQGKDHQVRAMDHAGLLNVSKEVLANILGQISGLGSDIALLESWSSKDAETPTFRRFQSAVEKELTDFRMALASFELMAMSPGLEVTLIEFMRKLDEMKPPLQRLKSVIPDEHSQYQDIRLLDNLIDRINQSESVMDSSAAADLILVFQSCFQAYWRPIESWLVGHNITCTNIDFLRRTANRNMLLEDLWQTELEVVHRNDGQVLAPVVLQPHVHSILVLGKTVSMLTRLESEAVRSPFEDNRRWMTLISADRQVTFEPFKEKMNRAIENHLRASTGISMKLRKELQQKWLLWETVSALDQIFLARFGSINDKVHCAIFRLMDSDKNQKWEDRFVLTNIFQNAFGSADIDGESLVVEFVPSDRTRRSRTRSIVRLEAVKIGYQLPWPLANIFSQDTMMVYGQVAILLMQIARAKHVLDYQQSENRARQSESRSSQRLLLRLQQLLRWFVNILHSYLALDVLPYFRQRLHQTLNDAQDFDTMIEGSKLAISMVKHRCLLTDDLTLTHQAIVSLLDLTVVLSGISTQCDRRPASGPRRRLKTSADGSSEGQASSDQSDEIQTNRLGVDEGAKLDELNELSQTFQQLLRFVRTGLQDASRKTSDASIQLLADDITIELTSGRRR